MALTIRQSPADYALAYNPQIYVASSSYTDLSNYELLVNLYKNNVLQDSITLTKLPLSSGYVVFDIQSIIENYLSSDFAATQAFQTNDNSFVQVRASLRDYSTAGGWGAYVNHTYYAWNAVVETIDFNSFTNANYSDTTYFLTRNDITQSTSSTENAELYLISTILISGTNHITDGQWLIPTDTSPWGHDIEWFLGVPGAQINSAVSISNQEYHLYKATNTTIANTNYIFTLTIASISEGSYITLTYGSQSAVYTEAGTYDLIAQSTTANDTVYIDFWCNTTGDTVFLSSITVYETTSNKAYKLEVKTYTSSGTLIGTKAIKNDQIGTSDKYKFLRVPAGKYNLNQVNNALLLTGSQPLIESNCSYYTLTIKNISNVAYATKTFNVSDDCARYDKYRLHWLNRLGGYDSYTFDLVSKKNIDIEKKTFKKQLGSLTIQNSGAASFSYQNSDRQDSQYYTKYKNRTLITSDWLTNDESDWLSELMTSPSVFWERGSNDFVAVNINANTYEIKNNKVDKIFNHTLEFSLSFDEFTQTL